MEHIFEMIDAVWKAINARTKRIEELEARVEALEARLAESDAYRRPVLALAESPQEAAGRA